MLEANKRTLKTSPRTLLGLGPKATADTIQKNLTLRRKAARRAVLDARQCKNAIEQILELPKPGESLHFIVDGLFEPCDLIPATRRLSDPAVIQRLDITTLGVNNDNTSCIANGMDQGKILECSILVSQYFCRVEKGDYQFLKQELEQRGGRVNAMRTHSKLMLMELTDGNFFTVEGSGNLRSCQSIEQFVMTNDRELLLFHRAWIEEYINTREDGRESNRRRKARAP
jgi:hypothetical protein